MVSVAGLAVTMALFIPPTIPDPPSDRMAAAAELFRVGPLPADFRNSAKERAVLEAARSALTAASKKRNYPEMLASAQQAITNRVGREGVHIDGAVTGCLSASLGHSFDLTTLQEMKEELVTKGVSALELRPVKRAAQPCYNEAVWSFLSGLGVGSAISWMAEQKLLARALQYDPLQADQSTLVRGLEALCGRRARGALEWRGNVLGIPPVQDRRLKVETSYCLISAAKVAGKDLVYFQN